MRKHKISRKSRKISLKRRLKWLGAWTVVILVFLSTAGMIAATISGIKNVYNQSLAQESKKDTAYAVQITQKDEIIEKTKSDTSTTEELSWGMEEEGHSLNDVTGDTVDVSSLLVNKSMYLPTDYRVNLTTLKNGQQVASVIYEDLRNMLFDGEEQEKGLSFLVASGYRSAEEQTQLLQDEIIKNESAGMEEDEARRDALLTVAPVHYSEHETGLAVDIVSVANQRMDATQEYTPENKWLQENCWKYGFILRYPKEKEDVTGFSYESWHFRYVGKTAAKEIMERSITLEEYLAETE